CPHLGLATMNVLIFLSHRIDTVAFVIIISLALVVGRFVLRSKHPGVRLPTFAVVSCVFLALIGVCMAELYNVPRHPIPDTSSAAEWFHNFLHMRVFALIVAASLAVILVFVAVLTALMRAEIQQRIEVEKQLVRAKEMAERANQAKSEFLAHFSHEL